MFNNPRQSHQSHQTPRSATVNHYPQQQQQYIPLSASPSPPPPKSHSPFHTPNPVPPPTAATAFANASAGKIHIVGSTGASSSSPSTSPSPRSAFRSFVPGTIQSPIVHTKRIQAYMSRKVSDLVGGVLDDDAGESRAPYQQLPPAQLNASSAEPYATTTSVNMPPAFTSPNGFPSSPHHHHQQREGSFMSNASTASAFFYPSPNSGVSRAEVWRMLANRVYFSKFYKLIYVTMTILALITVVLSFVNTCPTTLFLALECIVNLTLIIEVGIRFLAARRQFFQSRANVLDVILVTLCLFLLGMVLHDAKSCKAGGEGQQQQRGEALVDSVLLIIRNTLQLARIVNMLHKNQTQLNAHVASVDFTGLEDGGHQDPLLFDAEDEQLGFGVSITPAGNQHGSNQSLLPR